MADIPTIGTAMRVAVAAPFLNARGERDCDMDGSPDDWTITGGSWARRYGTHGASSASCIRTYVGTSDTITLKTSPDVIPLGSSLDVQGELVFYASKYFAFAAINANASLKMYTSSGATQSTASTVFGTDYGNNTYWYRSTIGVSGFIDKTNLDTSRATITLDGNAPCAFNFDTPVLGWRADGADDSDRWYVMDSPPSAGTTITSGITGSMTRDASGGIYYADPYGASTKWKLTLNYEYMSDADYQYWCACYSVNRGASGYMNASGGQLGPQPIAVEHFLCPSTSTSDKDHMARPHIIVGNITTLDLTVREYLGFGYQGSIVIEEA